VGGSPSLVYPHGPFSQGNTAPSPPVPFHVDGIHVQKFYVWSRPYLPPRTSPLTRPPPSPMPPRKPFSTPASPASIPRSSFSQVGFRFHFCRLHSGRFTSQQWFAMFCQKSLAPLLGGLVFSFLEFVQRPFLTGVSF